jgi:ubiquitin C
MMTQPLPAPPDTAELAQKKNERAAFNLLHPGKIQIAIKTQSEFSIMLILDPGQSVKRLKEKIEDEAQIPVENQRLLFGGASLDDDRTVGDYGVSHGNTILLSTSVVPRLPQTIETLDKLTVQDEVQIFVRNLNGKTMAVMISPSDTVDRLHELVFERTGIPTSEQRLLYGGKQLEAGRLLSDYGILKESTLHLVLRLRGGLLTRQTRPARRLSRPRI